MNMEMTRVSSRGQVVIPEFIREQLGIKDGSRLLVFGEGDTIILKKVMVDSEKDFQANLAMVRRKIRQLGITRKDVTREVQAVRSERRARRVH